MTEIQKITSAHVGVPTNRLLKLKAAETKYFFWFLHNRLKSVWPKLDQGRLWLQAANHMFDLLQALASMPWKLSLAQEQDYNKWGMRGIKRKLTHGAQRVSFVRPLCVYATNSIHRGSRHGIPWRLVVCVCLKLFTSVFYEKCPHARIAYKTHDSYIKLAARGTDGRQGRHGRSARTAGATDGCVCSV